MDYETADKIEEHFVENKVFETVEFHEHSVSDDSAGDENGDDVSSCDENNDNQSDDLNMDMDIVPAESSNIFRPPRHINDVNLEQKHQIINQYFDMSCDYCDTRFREFEDATQHYRTEHANQAEGYVKCCDKIFKVRKKFNDHIVFHLNPEAFK